MAAIDDGGPATIFTEQDVRSVRRWITSQQTQFFNEHADTMHDASVGACARFAGKLRDLADTLLVDILRDRQRAETLRENFDPAAARTAPGEGRGKEGVE